MTPNRQRSVTVFVHRERGVFMARTHAADAIHLDSATVAARRCAAAHFAVDETEIEIIPDTEHVLIAVVKEPSKAIAWVVISWLVGIAAAVAGVAFIVGGAS
jgi:hypothetical protein